MSTFGFDDKKMKLLNYFSIRQVHTLTFIACYALLSGCTPHYATPLTSEKISELTGPSKDSTYRLNVGDQLSVSFYFNDKQNQQVKIGPDGKINLPLVDTVNAAGLSIEELDASLTSKYAKALKTSFSDYTLTVGDKIGIRSYYNDKLNDEVIIRPDGKISLILIGELNAAGISPSILENTLQEKYSAILENPDVSVIIRESKHPDLTVSLIDTSSQKIYIGGEVHQPGILPINGNLRILDAIISSGGISGGGNPSNVILARKGQKEIPEMYSLNINSIISGEMPNFNLLPYDIVYIPRTGLADAANFLRNNLYSLLPDHVLFSFPYNLNKEVQVVQ